MYGVAKGKHSSHEKDDLGLQAAECYCLLRHLLAMPNFVTHGMAIAAFRGSHL